MKTITLVLLGAAAGLGVVYWQRQQRTLPGASTLPAAVGGNKGDTRAQQIAGGLGGLIGGVAGLYDALRPPKKPPDEKTVSSASLAHAGFVDPKTILSEHNTNGAYPFTVKKLRRFTVPSPAASEYLMPSHKIKLGLA